MVSSDYFAKMPTRTCASEAMQREID